MTENQFNHYIKGGIFRANYMPTKADLSEESMEKIGKEIFVFQNIDISPITTGPYTGQHRFNSHSIGGWIPEEDLEITLNTPHYNDEVYKPPMYIYKLHYSTKEQIQGCFGNVEIPLPYIAERAYPSDSDEYVLSLSNPQCDKIEKTYWKGEYQEKLIWTTLKL
jgi:hypothetical protein